MFGHLKTKNLSVVIGSVFGVFYGISVSTPELSSYIPESLYLKRYQLFIDFSFLIKSSLDVEFIYFSTPAKVTCQYSVRMSFL